MSVNGFTFGTDPTIQKYNYESLDNIPDIENGTYPNMAVGSLLGTNKVTDKEPYFLRPCASIGDREFDTLVGGTLGWNQLLQNGNFESDTGWGARNGTVSVADNVMTITATQTGTLCGLRGGSFTIQTDHVYSAGVGIYAPITGTVGVSFGGESALTVNHAVTANAWAQCDVIIKSNKNEGKSLYALINESINTGDIIKYRTAQVIDLTTLFGSTIADYIYSLEQATAGAGVAWVRKYLPKTYYPYCAPTLKHVSGVSAHVMRDANNNIIGNYPIDSTWVGMGIPKLDSANKLYFDGDTYASDGTVTERYGIRAYQSGDESLADAITDGTNTVYKLTTPTTSSASPFTSPQICDPDGTEEYVTTGLVPVGHETEYVENLADKLTDIPDLPTTAGTYSLKVTVSGGVPSYSWVTT